MGRMREEGKRGFTMIRTTFKIHLIARYIEHLSLDCHVAFLARDAWFVSISI